MAKVRSTMKKTLEVAEAYVGQVKADYGGTEILSPLMESMRMRRTDCQTSIILLTDGQVYNTTSIVNTIAQEKAKHKDKPLRVFSLGIGDSVSHHLVEGISRAGGGYGQLVMGQERLDKKVVRMLAAALLTPLNDLHVEWPGKPAVEELLYKFDKVEVRDDFEVVEKPEKQSTTFFDKGADDIAAMKSEAPPEAPKYILTTPIMQQIPETIPPLYNGSRNVMFFLLPTSHPTPQSLTLKGATPDGTVMSLDIPVSDSIVLEGTSKPIVHTLAAKTLLSQLEEGRLIVQEKHVDDLSLAEAVKQEGIRIGVKFSLASKWTSFVAVDKKSKDMIPVGNRHDLDHGEPDFSNESNYSSPHSYPYITPLTTAKRASRMGMPAYGRLVGGGGPMRHAPPAAPGGMDTANFSSTGDSRFSTFGAKASSPPGLPREQSVGALKAKHMSFETSAPLSLGADRSPDLRLNKREMSSGEPASDRKRSIPQSDADKVHEIIMQQSSSGAFPANVILADILGFSTVDAFMKTLPRDLSEVADAELWMTIMVCLYLETKLSKEMDVWELVVEKGWQFATSSIGAEKVSSLKKAAEAAI